MQNQQPLRQHPIIGSKYEGPPFERPTLRKMPPGWTLEAGDTPDPWNKITVATMIALVVWSAWVIVRAL